MMTSKSFTGSQQSQPQVPKQTIDIKTSSADSGLAIKADYFDDQMKAGSSETEKEFNAKGLQRFLGSSALIFLAGPLLSTMTVLVWPKFSQFFGVSPAEAAISQEWMMSQAAGVVENSTEKTNQVFGLFESASFYFGIGAGHMLVMSIYKMKGGKIGEFYK